MSSMTLTPASQVRLTRRGRLVIFLAAMVVLLGAALAVANASMASNEPGAVPETRVVMVGYGETLWDISSDLAEDGKVREMIQSIKQLNALDSAMLMAGQEIHVPVID